MPITNERETLTKASLSTLFGEDSQVFLSDYLGKQPMHVRNGPAARTIQVSWADINASLDAVARYPQVRLLERGKVVPPARYTTVRQTVALDDAVGRHMDIDPYRCQLLMRQGATLIMSATEKLTPALTALTRQLRTDLCGDVRVDIVITLAETPAFPNHWDHTDCINVHLAGRKLWKVYRPARPWPLGQTQSYLQRSDLVELAAPGGPPALEIALNVGDVLYVPRGWWHEVTPVQGPCLHLAISVDMPTVQDALAWHVDRLKQHEIVRRCIPHWQTQDEWRAFAASVQQIVGALTPDQIMTEFLAYYASSDDQVTFTLPGPAHLNGAPPDQAHMLARLRERGQIAYAHEGADLVFAPAGRPYRFSNDLEPLLRRLNGVWAPFRQLAEGIDATAAYGLLLTLWHEGVVCLCDERECPADARVPRWALNSRS